jgi:ABC-type phosphate/phosphonate transport system substrate-binding protein
MKKLFITSLTALFLFSIVAPALSADLTCWFPPGWKKKAAQAKTITAALSDKSGVKVKPRIAKSYPDILKAFATDAPNLVYVGSFVQAIIAARGLGTPLAQNVNGKELYGSFMIFPKGKDPKAILASSPEKIAFARGASSGESGAKAATLGKAKMGTPNHGATAGAVKAGKAAAGFVKNWWWAANKAKFPTLDMYQVPGASDVKNPDNVLTASKAVPADVMAKIKTAAISSPDAFGAKKMADFSGNLDFSISNMKAGKIDPMTYSW